MSKPISDTQRITGPIGYLFSRFPHVPETFILHEMLWLINSGVDIEVFPLIRQKTPIVHPGTERILRNLHYAPILSARLLVAQVYWIFTRPIAYAKCWMESLAGTARSPSFFFRTPMVVLKAAYYAHRARQLNIRHLHAHYMTYPGLMAYCIHILTGISYSITVHAHDIFINRTMMGSKIRRSAGIVAISEYNRRYLIGLHGTLAEEKITVIRCGVDTACFRPSGIPLQKRPPLIVCVASLQPYKGHRYLIDACAELRDRAVSFRCFCIGRGILEGNLRKTIERLGLRRHVRLLGALPNDLVRRILAHAAVVALPSVVQSNGKMEGIPVALMEAMAMGLPVVSSNLSGIPELVMNEKCGGILVPPQNSQALAQAIESLLSDRENAATLAHEGRLLVERMYDHGMNMALKKDYLISLARS